MSNINVHTFVTQWIKPSDHHTLQHPEHECLHLPVQAGCQEAQGGQERHPHHVAWQGIYVANDEEDSLDGTANEIVHVFSLVGFTRRIHSQTT